MSVKADGRERRQSSKLSELYKFYQTIRLVELELYDSNLFGFNYLL